MRIQKIVVAGPPSAEAFLKKLASAIVSDEVDIDLQLGLAAPADTPCWSETQIFV